MRPSLLSEQPSAIPSKRDSPLVVTAVLVLYAFATLQFVRFYVVSATPYLRLPAYLAGHERLPFQFRILPAWILRGFYALHLLHTTGMHTKGAFTADRAPIYLLALPAVVLAGLCTQWLYRTFSPRGRLGLLVYPVLLFTLMWTYSVHVEANFSYPYDMLAVAFFAAGLVCIGRGLYLPLLLIMLLGTLNRETTLFLVGLYVLDAASVRPEPVSDRLRDRFNLRQVPWLRALLLLVCWVGVKLVLSHHFGGNDRSEDFNRLRQNLPQLKPRLWPALLNICGYMLPVVLLLRRDLRPMRFRNYLWIFPLWFAVMLYAAVIVETRIYGELCPYVAVALVVIVEGRLQTADAAETTPLADTSPVRHASHHHG